MSALRILLPLTLLSAGAPAPGAGIQAGDRSLTPALVIQAAPPPPARPRSIDPAAIDLDADASELPRLKSLLVSSHGALVAEYYARGVRPTTLANIKSASKSIVSILVGIAIDRGQIAGLHEPIATYFPELGRDADDRKTAITIEDMLTMRTGLQSTSGPNYGAWVLSANWVRYALTRPMVAPPGRIMQYSTGTSHLLSAILTKATGASTWRFAQEALAAPLGFSLAQWPRDPQGIYFGGNEMLLTPRQMVAVGELYLHRGRADRRQIVPAEWVDASCTPRTRSNFDADRQYGYGWWIQQFDGGEACFAWGYGGQYILVFRDLDLVVVATSSTTVSEERRGHRRALFQLIEQRVLRAFGGAPAIGAGSRRQG
ncbi:MAG: serine hydrolase domain-containing protein [Vicinamibacterales bacterium]